MVQLKINMDSGGLPIEDIMINYNTKALDKMMPESKLLERNPSEDKVKFIFYNNNDKPVVSGILLSTKTGEYSQVFFIEEIDPKETKSFPMKIRKARSEKKSELSFEFRGSSKEPIPTYQKSNQINFVIPKGGHY